MKQTLRLIVQVVWMSLLLGVLFAYAMFQGGFTSWFLFDSFLPIFAYQLCLLLYPLKGWKVTRTLTSNKVRAGDHLSVAITVKRKFPFPLYYCVIEENVPESLNRLDIRKRKYAFMDSPEKLSTRRQMKKLIFPWFKKQMTVSYELVQVPRGKHEFTAVCIRTGDIFGFIKKERVFKLKDELITYPAQPTIKLKESMKNQKQGSLASSVMQLQSGNVATSIREYVPGDKFSWIDWKQTAKKNDVMTKEFERDKSTDVLIVLDGCQHERQNWIQLDAAIELSSSLLKAFEKKSSKITLLSVGNEVKSFSKGQMQMERIYQHLSSIKPVQASFSTRLLQEVNKMPPGFVTFVLTTNLDEMLLDVLKKMNLHSYGIHVLYVHSTTKLAGSDQHLIRSMVKQGITVSTFMNKQLTAEPIEVNAF